MTPRIWASSRRLPAGVWSSSRQPATSRTPVTARRQVRGIRSSDAVDLLQDLSVFPPAAGGRLGERPAHHALLVDQYVRAIGVELVLEQGTVEPRHLALEIAEQVDAEVLLRLEFL